MLSTEIKILHWLVTPNLSRMSAFVIILLLCTLAKELWWTSFLVLILGSVIEECFEIRLKSMTKLSSGDDRP